MRLLLDSHVALWWLEAADDLGPECIALIESADDVSFSAVTPWELGIKRALGKLNVEAGLEDELDADGFGSLPITVTHASVAGALPPHHGDPFDRMLVAQAQLEDLTLVTRDPALQAYDVPILVA